MYDPKYKDPNKPEMTSTHKPGLEEGDQVDKSRKDVKEQDKGSDRPTAKTEAKAADLGEINRKKNLGHEDADKVKTNTGIDNPKYHVNKDKESKQKEKYVAKNITDSDEFDLLATG